VSARHVGLVSSNDGYGDLLRRALEQRGLVVRRTESLADLIESNEVDLIGLFLDTMADGKDLTAAVRRARKPVLVLAAGPAHGDVSRAALRQAGALLAGDTEEWLDGAALLAAYAGESLPGGRRVRLSGTSGSALLARDACEDAGLQIVAADEGFDGLTVVENGSQWAVRAGREPNKEGLVIFPTPERAARACKILVEHAESTRRRPLQLVSPAMDVVPMNIDGSGIMDEHEAKRLLDRWQVPVVPGTLVTGPGRHEFTPIRKLATHFGFPVVLKAIRRDIVHKAEMGAVVAGIATIDQLEATWQGMHARFPDAAWLIQPFLPGDVEVLIAAKRDPVFGPVVMFGPGGVMTELYRDVSLRVAPLTEADALEMIEETKAADLMRGFHGLPVYEPREVADVLIKVGQLMLGQPSVLEIDLNPLLLTEKGPIVVDAKARIS
jgi:acyl-CoA synthetase (NDP forming)